MEEEENGKGLTKKEFILFKLMLIAIAVLMVTVFFMAGNALWTIRSGYLIVRVLTKLVSSVCYLLDLGSVLALLFVLFI